MIVVVNVENDVRSDLRPCRNPPPKRTVRRAFIRRVGSSPFAGSRDRFFSFSRCGVRTSLHALHALDGLVDRVPACGPTLNALTIRRQKLSAGNYTSAGLTDTKVFDGLADVGGEEFLPGFAVGDLVTVGEAVACPRTRL